MAEKAEKEWVIWSPWPMATPRSENASFDELPEVSLHVNVHCFGCAAKTIRLSPVRHAQSYRGKRIFRRMK
eukprot:6153345-Prorocentrum_lima.AAC.1